MHDLVLKARRYATEAHSRINHRRKYSHEPYDVHLRDVAGIVASVTDDPEMIAAAWLHDVVEDTPATFLDIEREFGPELAGLVAELTDVSRPSDGNRATRKAIDRAHLAEASTRGKTIKLADLIDNCRDICARDHEFARVFLTEMAGLLEVLRDGDTGLYRRACTMLEENAADLGLPLGVVGEGRRYAAPSLLEEQDRLPAYFQKLFTARDIARGLASVDFPPRESAARLMTASNLPVLGVRHEGQVRGYLLREDPERERCIQKGQTVGDDACFSEVILVLSHHPLCFVRVFDSVAGVISRDDIQHPYMRMWLFGIITMAEMKFAALIDRFWPGDSWRALVSPGRLAKAEALREERVRCGQQPSLLSCLQLSDKMQILIENERLRIEHGFVSRKQALKVSKEFESLRNNLAHAQDIVVTDFAQIARIAQRMESVRDAAEQ